MVLSIELYRGVFRSIYLRNKVFQHVVNIHRLLCGGQDSSQSHSQSHQQRRRRTLQYNQIDSAQWMIHNGYIELLIDKIMNTRHRVYFSTNSIRWLLKNHHTLSTTTLIQSLYQCNSWLFSTQQIDVAESICAGGSLELLRFFVEQHRYPISSSSLEMAASNGHLNIIQHLVNQHTTVRCTPYCYEAAAARGHLDIIKLLHSKSNIKPSTQSLDVAAQNGHLDVVRYLLLHAHVTPTSRATDLAVANGHLETARFLLNNVNLFSSMLPVYACQSGSMDLVKDCNNLGNRVKFTTACMDVAPSLEIIRYLHHNRPEGCTFVCFDNAVSRADIDSVVFLFERYDNLLTLPLINKLLFRAGTKGLVDIMAYIHQKAISKGDLNGMVVPWTSLLMENQSLAVIELLHNLSIPGCRDTTMAEAALHGSLDIVQFLNEKRTESTNISAINNAAKNGHLHIVDYLHRNRTEQCSERALHDAAANGHLRVVEYLLANNMVHPNQKSLEAAIRGGDIGIVEKIMEHNQNIRLTIKIVESCLLHVLQHANVPMFKWLLDRTGFEVLNQPLFNQFIATILELGLEEETIQYLYKFNEQFQDIDVASLVVSERTFLSTVEYLYQHFTVTTSRSNPIES
ncbi:hypothetical protein SAMD00019534_041160, partial [Acytostelium subglobosum LB1]|uniref:hypothetical protein n=1 Tax=Acytostelium subglobosum LB1 TaxID=1410327 RepID=UPI0006449277